MRRAGDGRDLRKRGEAASGQNLYGASSVLRFDEAPVRRRFTSAADEAEAEGEDRPLDHAGDAVQTIHTYDARGVSERQRHPGSQRRGQQAHHPSDPRRECQPDHRCAEAEEQAEDEDPRTMASFAPVSIKDRTKEFAAAAERAAKTLTSSTAHAGAGAGNDAGAAASLLQNAGSIQHGGSSSSAAGTQSEFSKMASRIGHGIHGTSQKLERLAQLAKRSSMFDDPAQEIAELSALIKQDITVGPTPHERADQA